MKLVKALVLLSLFGFTLPGKQTKPATNADNRIQVAILLDVSGSMNGLIEQAKAQLWNMVNTLGKAQTASGVQPKIEVALYEYGRTSADNNGKGYVKMLSPFTSELDKVSEVLFGLRTSGGDEFCGQVIYTSLDELKWDTSKDTYKVIFIAGNEDFLQGSTHYTQACAKANAAGVIVNTIYCGSYEMGIKEHWQLLGECGNGGFSNIDHNAKEDNIATPYDTTLITLNQRLNATYIAYGIEGGENLNRQARMDAENARISANVAAKRAEAKARSNVYSNASWDLVDAYTNDSLVYKKIKKEDLPESMRNKKPEEIRKDLVAMQQLRGSIQREIVEISANRNRYIQQERARSAGDGKATLESAVEKTIREQAKRFNLVIEQN